MKADGDAGSADERRAAAIRLLARPVEAAQFLAKHAAHSAEAATDDTSDDEASGAAEDASSAEAGLSEEEAPWSSDAEPDPDVDEACVAEWTPTWHTPSPTMPPSWPESPPIVEPDDPVCRSGSSSDRVEPQLRLDLNLPAGFDAKAAKPRIVLHYHLSNQGLMDRGTNTLVRPEHADPIRLTELLDLLNTTGCVVKVQPVIDPADTAPADAYEIADKVRAAVRYRDIADVNPWGTSLTRSLDLDHTIPYQHGEDWLPGQTSYDNLGPLNRSAHRVKTLGLKQVRQPDPGTFIWRSQHGHISVVTNRGTINLGRTPFTAALWKAATPPKSTIINRAERIILEYQWLEYQWNESVTEHSAEVRIGAGR